MAEAYEIEGANENDGWQKVTKVKKQRWEAAKLGAAQGAQQERLVGDSGASKLGLDSKVVQVLESSTKKRRARRKAKKEAAAAAVGAPGENDINGDYGQKRVKGNGSKEAIDIKKPKADKAKKAKKPKMSVQEAATAIAAIELETFLSGTSESFQTLPELELKAAESVTKSLLRKTSRFPVFITAVVALAIVAASGGFYLLSSEVNPWGWDGYMLLGKIHSFLGF